MGYTFNLIDIFKINKSNITRYLNFLILIKYTNNIIILGII